MSAIISLRGVSKVFPVQGRHPGQRGQRPDPVRAVDDVTLDIEEGTVVGIVGYSGAGKSTLVRLLNGLERPTEGQVFVKGQDISSLPEGQLRKVRAGIGMIFQQFNLLKSRTVFGNVAYPLKVAGWPKEKIKPRVEELLVFVGIADKASSYPRRLSGGQQQRVGIARALANAPDILLADEATSALDPETTRDVLRLLRRINKELGTTVVVITHEMHVVREICDTVVMMESGRVVETGPTYSVFADPQSDSTQRFVSTAVHGTPEVDTVSRLAAAHPGQLVSIGISEAAPTPLVAATFARHGVGSSVVFGGVTEIQNKILGTLTYELTGSETAIDAALAELGDVTAVERQTPTADPADSAVPQVPATVPANAGE
ncbi:methionine ABC transporter (ATP-binding protein) [Arthrobacter sp. 9V]|uniref:methionine ABC transporter ATP-binding protein n=1 Tax=Arthrobacter sp. 9V TaxID=2653132 RepID=UPI0012EFAC5A|nr:methionine ABC transporter ATP-binding protein [Arthrobacter sp. 9V]VXB50028.1 methionine ABC transporter (ATP-binding protein) [Arthrobacter sp. 9V]